MLTLMFESSNRERISDFDLKLMSIDSETLDIPDQVRQRSLFYSA